MKRSKKIAASFVLVGVMLVSSIAYAAWTASGSGSGFAKASTAQSLTTVDVSASTSATLYPGATGNASVRINNPNPYPVRVTAVAGSGTIDSDSTAACDASTGVTFTDQTGLTLDIPASSAQTFTLTNAVAMDNSSHNDCQGAVFTIPVTLTGASNA